MCVVIYNCSGERAAATRGVCVRGAVAAGNDILALISNVCSNLQLQKRRPMYIHIYIHTHTHTHTLVYVHADVYLVYVCVNFPHGTYAHVCAVFVVTITVRLYFPYRTLLSKRDDKRQRRMLTYADVC